MSATRDAECAARRRELLALRHWRLNLENYTIEGARGVPYYVDLEECLTSAAVLDWIAQVAGKVWCSAEVLGELVRAMDLVLRLQATLCGFGVGKRLTRAQVRARCREVGTLSCSGRRGCDEPA